MLNKNEFYIELVAGFIILFTALSLFIMTDMFEWLLDFTQKYEAWELFEFFSLFIALLITGTALSVRQFFVMNKLIRDLNEANEQIIAHEKEENRRHKMLALGSLAGGLAHEINNSLQPTLGLGKFIRQTLEDNKDTKHLAYMDIILNSSIHAHKIIENVLLFASEKNLEFKEMLAFNVISQTLKFCKDLLPETVHFKITGIPEDLNKSERLMIICNHTGFYQILFNLLKNASNATNNIGEIGIDISRGFMPNRLEEIPSICMKITDHGHGMDEETVTKIFDPFFSTKDISEGTGLGLTIVYFLVRQHNGFIDVKSEVGVGTTFTLDFPILQKQKDKRG